MLTYRYNLRSLGYFEDEYDKISSDALRLARSSSAVDTGKFRRGWIVRVKGDDLFVQNSVRYAPFVELGSIVYKKHKYKVRNALATLGLTRGIESIGNFRKTFSTSVGSEQKPLDSKIQIVSIPTIAPLTDQEIRSPALLVQRLRPKRQTRTRPARIIPTGQLFNRSRLLELIAAVGIVNQIKQNNEE